MNSTTHSPQWIFIDLDDTLWDFSANSTDALLYLYGSHAKIKNLIPSGELFLERYFFHNERLWNDYHHRRITSGFLKGERFRAVLREFTDIENIIDEGDNLNNLYLSILSNGSKLTNGAEPLLRRLADKFLIGIISNGFIEVQYKKIYNSPIHKYIQRMIISDEIGITKPDPAIFAYAIAETGADPESVIMIGDNPDTDIFGAVNAGWKAIFYNRKSNSLPENIDLNKVAETNSLDDIDDKIRILSQG